jgi:large subunit ribosomal protein L17
MRHRKAGVHLSRTSAHRQALFSNMIASLFEHEKIRTTHAKARATRQVAERTITIARRVGDVLSKSPEKRSAEESARVVQAMRQARTVVRNRDAVQKLFEDIGPRFAARRGGYTRIIKLDPRPGDNAPMSLLELVDGPTEAPKEEAPKAEKAAKSKAASSAKPAKAKAKSDDATEKATAEKKPAAKKASKKKAAEE